MTPQKELQIGGLKLRSPVLYAPLAGCSDFPFRMMSARYKPGLMFCEMVKMEALVRSDLGTFQMLDYHPSMRPIGGQLCGSKPELAFKAAKIIEELGFDTIDLNCGCPVDKVTKDGSGSGLLKNPYRIGDIISNMVAAVKIPVTVKIRAGWDNDNLCGPEITKIAEKAGAQAITVHGRTRAQAYRGPAEWRFIKECKDAATTIKVIGNGDLFTAHDVPKMFEYTGCDGVLVARGTMGQPWIAQDILDVLSGKEPYERSLEEMRQALFDHFLYTHAYHNDRKTIIDMRRVGCWYLKKASGTRAFREKISRSSSVDDVRELILNFPLGELNAAEESLEENCAC